MEKALNFNIDDYLNPYIPKNQVRRLPKSLSRWLGQNDHKDPPFLITHTFATLGSFLGLLVVGAVFKYAPGIVRFHPPVIIASLGASAILEYAAIQTPLSQPRNALLGHGLSAIVGVAISKAFQTHANFADLQWVAAAVACAACTLTMSLTNSIHPPGGATAVLTCIDASVIAMGWWFVPVIIVAVLLMLGVSLINNNIMRRFPIYWWTSAEVGQAYNKQKTVDEEKHIRRESQQSDATLQPAHDWRPSLDEIHVTAYEFKLPAGLELRPEELEVLRGIQLRLAKQPQS